MTYSYTHMAAVGRQRINVYFLYVGCPAACVCKIQKVYGLWVGISHFCRNATSLHAAVRRLLILTTTTTVQ